MLLHHGAGDDLDAELCQTVSGFFRQQFSKAGKDALSAVEQDYRCCRRIDPPKVPAQSRGRHLRQRCRQFDAGRSRADQDKRHLPSALVLVVGRFRHLVRTQNFRSYRFGVRDRFQAWSVLGKFVMTEIARLHAGGDHQIVKAYFLDPDARTIGVNGSGSQIDADNFAQDHRNILLLRFKLPNRRRNLGRRKDRRRHLIQKRLENVMIAPINHDDFGIAMAQRFCCRNSREAPADDNDLRPLGAAPHCRRRLLLRPGNVQSFTHDDLAISSLGQSRTLHAARAAISVRPER